MKAFEYLGLTEKEIIEMQKWLYPMIIGETESISKMIVNTVEKYEGTMLYYALYHLGNRIGEAQVKEQIGVPCVLNPEEV